MQFKKNRFVFFEKNTFFYVFLKKTKKRIQIYLSLEERRQEEQAGQRMDAVGRVDGVGRMAAKNGSGDRTNIGLVYGTVESVGRRWSGARVWMA